MNRNEDIQAKEEKYLDSQTAVHIISDKQIRMEKNEIVCSPRIPEP